MEHVRQVILTILDIIDQHEGSVAMLGIAISVLIFRKEVTNNYFTLEKDNFNDLFKDITLKQLPEKIAGVEEASESEWSDKFSELIDVLEEMLEKAKYFKYSMPYFYRSLKLMKNEIGDLERHENWRIYRNSIKQNHLIERKCKIIIQTINDASKGRVLKIRWRQNNWVTAIRNFLVKKFIDRPIDRVLGTVIGKNFSKSFKMFIGNGNEKREINSQWAKNLETRVVSIEPRNHQITHVTIRSIETSSKFYFGYFAGIRMGRRIGNIVLRANKDSALFIKKNRSNYILSWNDNNIHKIVISWRLRDDYTHLFYDVLKIKSIY